MTTSTAHALAGHPLDDELVLANRPLVDSADLASTSRFRDDIWDLVPALHMRHYRTLRLNFTAVPAQFRQPAKELFFALLRHDHPYGQPQQKIITVHGRFGNVKAFLVWAGEHGARSLRELGLDDFEAYDRHVTAQRYEGTTASAKRGAVRMLWIYRTKLTGDALSMDPQIAFDASPAAGSRTTSAPATENATLRIPEEVLAPLLTWALRFVEDFADDILRAQQEWQDLRTQTRTRDGLIDGTMPFERFTRVLDRYRTEGRPLPRLPDGVLRSFANRPGYSVPEQPVNLSHLAREARMHPSSMRDRASYQKLIATAIEELGLDDTTYLHTQVRGTLDGRPWLDRLRWDHIETYVRALHSACYIVIAYLSGMRESEVKHIQRGCLSVWQDEEGRPVRHKITSQAFKGEDTPEGVEATWIVNAAAANAIRVLEALQPDDQPYLFAHPPTSRHFVRARINTVPVSSSTVENLAFFAEWVNDYCSATGRNDTIPKVNGRVWKLDTRQFRRTLAWSIARQPGGSIAGAIQYRHHSIQMFEGYAGTSTSGFRPEVEAEQAIARGEKLGDIILNPAPQRLTGPAAEEAEARLAAMESEVEFLGKVITDRKRLQRFMKRNDPHIYPGEFVTCVYNPDRALCRREAEAGPSLPDCQPTKCRNVALTDENKDAFLLWLHRLERALAGTTLAPYVRHRMEERRADIARFLQANDIHTTQNQEPHCDAPDAH
ncbi:hypothetical protein [Streptomyces roseicoloratus]|uniref:hypothetical protein n=1 Tax=Streptomyces roseicoloratus TaxID=2508722 RepID=UPI001009C54C|nr:hypothetical protein [Streptomyces roseicoloratus]